MTDLDRRLATIGRLVMRRLVLPFSLSRERARALIVNHGTGAGLGAAYARPAIL